MKVYSWEIFEHDTYSFHILAESKEVAQERVEEYIKEKLDREIGCNDWYNFPDDYKYSEKDLDEVFTSFYPG